MFNFKKIFDSFYKKNKAVAVVIIYVVSYILVEILCAGIYKYATILEFTQDNILIHESRIKGLEERAVTHSMLSKDFVKRESFNNYIKRKDGEYHEQMEINNDLSAKVGFLQGQISMFSGMLDTIGLLDKDNGRYRE